MFPASVAPPSAMPVSRSIFLSSATVNAPSFPTITARFFARVIPV